MSSDWKGELRVQDHREVGTILSMDPSMDHHRTCPPGKKQTAETLQNEGGWKMIFKLPFLLYNWLLGEPAVHFHGCTLPEINIAPETRGLEN